MIEFLRETYTDAQAGAEPARFAAGVISAGVVNVLNNPLSIIAGYTQVLGRDTRALESGLVIPPETVRLRPGSIQRETARCDKIAKRLLISLRNRYAESGWGEVSKFSEDAAILVRATPRIVGWKSQGIPRVYRCDAALTNRADASAANPLGAMPSNR